MNSQSQEPQDIYDDRFADQVFVPDDRSGLVAVLADLRAMTERVISWRESLVKTLADSERTEAFVKDLIQRESEFGARVFGVAPAGVQRSFFCLDRQTWIWYEAWVDRTTRQTKEQTIRYEITADAVFKSNQVATKQILSGHELENFYNAVKVYSILLAQNIYNRLTQN